MAWRPNEDLIDGELSNRVPGIVTGWMRFFRKQRQPLRVVFYLVGDFHEDIRGSDIVLKNDAPADRNISLQRDGTYMDGFERVQRGKVGDMTAGLPLGPGPKNLLIVSRHNLRSSGKKTVSRMLSWRNAGEQLRRTTPRRSLRANSIIRTWPTPISSGIPTTAGLCSSSIRPKSRLSDRKRLPPRRARKSSLKTGRTARQHSAIS